MFGTFRSLLQRGRTRPRISPTFLRRDALLFVQASPNGTGAAKLANVLLAVSILVAPTTARAVMFDFDNAPIHTPLPLDLTVGGITAHFSATGQGYSIQRADVMGFTPAGFSGLCIYPSSVFLADLLVSFSRPLTDFSIMFAPEEYGCDDSALMRVTAYMNDIYVGTNTARADPPGTWPTGTLIFSSAQGFNRVVVHYDSRPPTCGDWGPIFMADNMDVTPDASAVSDAEIEPLALAPVVSPNPFGAQTTVRFGLARRGPVSVAVYDAAGRLVRILLAETVFEPGIRSIRWDGRDDRGHEVASGVYLCRVRTEAEVTAARMILLRAQ